MTMEATAARYAGFIILPAGHVELRTAMILLEHDFGSVVSKCSGCGARWRYLGSALENGRWLHCFHHACFKGVPIWRQYRASQGWDPQPAKTLTN